MSGIVVPDELIASHTKFFAEAGRRWIATLPKLAEERLDRWQLRVTGPVTCGAVALIVPVARADGTRAVLKLQPVDDETVGEPIALRLWADRGAVPLLQHDPESGSMLLAQLDPSRSLDKHPDHLAAVEIIAGLLVRLNAVEAPPELRQLGDLALRMVEQTPALLARFADPEERTLINTCAARVSELLTEPVPNRLLHWDLHYFNVLAPYPGDPEPWMAIDPKPLAGDPGFELLPALWNRWGEVAASGNVTDAVLRRFDLMTEVIGLDRERASGWTLARVLQNALWDVGAFGESQVNPAHRAIAEALLTR